MLSRVIAGLVVLAVAAGAVMVWGYANFTGPGPLKTATILVVPKGLGVDGVANRLAEGGVLDSPRIFEVAVRLLGHGRALRAGEYQFPARASARDVMTILMFGKPVVRRITVPEGLTTAQIVAQIDRTEGLEGVIAKVPAEGSLMPETYNFSYGDSREEMVQRMRKAMTETLDTLWASRAADPVITTPEQALILASIVEKETARADERPRVAAVFINRLRDRMRLQSDPTVVYALDHGTGPLGRTLTHADLDTPSPYNTYLHDGLPPGPIDNPGKASITAVLHPADTDDLYFVADGGGGHAFAKTLDEHNKNVTKLRHLEAESRGATEPAQLSDPKPLPPKPLPPKP